METFRLAAPVLRLRRKNLLFPIPLLDGGHLFFYMIEAVRGKPVDQKIMGYSLNFGLALILCLTLFVTWNDLVKLNLF